MRDLFLKRRLTTARRCLISLIHHFQSSVINPKAVLQTKRLILRPFENSDFPDLLRHRSDERVMEFLGGIQDAETVMKRLNSYIENFDRLGYSMCAMIWKSTGKFIGVGGLQDIEGGTDVEVGFTVDPEFWRKGIATECTIACIKHGFDVLRFNRIIAQTRSDNTGSRMVLERAGMSFLEDKVENGEDWVRYYILRENSASLV